MGSFVDEQSNVDEILVCVQNSKIATTLKHRKYLIKNLIIKPTNELVTTHELSG